MTPRPTSFTWIIDLHPPPCPASPRPFLALRPLTHTHNNRKFATHRDRPTASSSTNVNDRLNPRVSLGASSMTGGESVGPFPLGVGPSGRNKTWKTWRELGLGGKLVRTTQQTGNLGVILVGGTLFVILAFALTTELFAKNSPSVLYSAAVDMIRDSDALNPHLLPPLKFTHSPYSSAPVRGSPPTVHQLVRHPTSGRDHLLLTFWVHGRGRDEPESLGWVKSAWTTVLGYGREAGRWAGLVQNGGKGAESEAVERKEVVPVAVDNQPGVMGRLFGSFTSLRTSDGSGTKSKAATRGLPPPGTYKIGEVRAEYVKNAGGQFNLLSLVIDVPSATASYPGRAVVFWSPEADTEGLLGRRNR